MIYLIYLCIVLIYDAFVGWDMCSRLTLGSTFPELLLVKVFLLLPKVPGYGMVNSWVWISCIAYAMVYGKIYNMLLGMCLLWGIA